MKNNFILVTGGAGYIGSVLTRKLVEKGYKVRILDSLIYGKQGIEELIDNSSVEFIKGDIRDEKIVKESIKGIDCIVHLSAIVGEPLCKKIPEAAKQINELATKKLIDLSKLEGVKRFIFSSTCSNYGTSDGIANEESDLHFLSLYSECKVHSEKYILDSKTDNFETCVLRFATAFGLSPRMRFDLLLQEFIRDALVNKEIILFGANYWRPLVHVNDISNACILSINGKTEKISGQVYNVGDDSQNYTKQDLAKIIQDKIPSTKISIVESKKDPRNYQVSFKKIKEQLGFSITKSAKDGIDEIINEVNNNNLDPQESEFSNMSKLTEKVNVY
ncbi:NAD-dependent epimerase/dehydratase family protein [Nitrosopumilus piranensis]|uniref:Nucleoside-diphosphate-sugar epimerase n=1 Tax=Nitrosopumilus piranensis TaxID=1582439 RepID=A0A0C5BT19_9ARCH|nr:NAD(P)-dependent oxidoreductase [Nitrosopumilus piranensis]AJM91289.1 Nucleoside-diphosphate-sugar epimerase [Nitrosopumilus piranensis]